MKSVYPIIIIISLVLSSCGYRFAEKSAHIPPSVTSISIPVFENKTMEPVIEEEITPAVIREFIKDRRLQVVDKSQSDLVLNGIVTSYKESPLSFDSNQNVLENRITISVHLRLLQPSSGNILMEKDVTKTAEYRVNSDVMITRAGRFSAIKELARILGEEITDRVLGGW
ncbi:MAG: LptE family protein [Nitrospirae bacterium]|nr:LptE family protein [Nitrospirota bacterium]